MAYPTLYEFPLNERMRNFMRLENYFTQIDYFSHHRTIWDSQASVLLLIEILNILDRNDIRSEVTRELERNITILSNLLNVPGINIHRLNSTLDELETHKHALQHIEFKPNKSIREDDLLNSIKQRVAISANVNSFDVPSFYYWLHQPIKTRQDQISLWLQEINPVADGICLLNRLLRDSQIFTQQIAVAGFFQQALNTQQTSQMVRIELPIDATYFPEISGSKHRVNIRFLTYDNSAQRPIQVTEDVEFNISCCSI